MNGYYGEQRHTLLTYAVGSLSEERAPSPTLGSVVSEAEQQSLAILEGMKHINV